MWEEQDYDELTFGPPRKKHILGMVYITCPCCGETFHSDVRMKTLESCGGNYWRVDYQMETPKHECLGRRS